MARVSVLELPARWGQAAEALREVDALLASAPTNLAILPEMALTGYVSSEGDFDLARFAEPIDGPTIRRVGEICRRRGAHVVAPLVLAEGTDVYNAAIVVAPDGLPCATYRKRHPWFPERWATPGPSPPPLFPIGDLAVTVAICFDGHFLADDAADILSTADLLAFTSAWVDEEDSRMPLLRSLARGFGLTVANANWGAGIVEVPGQGGSCIIDDQASVVARVDRGRRADAVVRPRSRH